MVKNRILVFLVALIISGSGSISTVFAADLVSTWTLLGNTSAILASHTSLVKNNILYLLGGSATTGQFGEQVYSSQISSSGVLSSWIDNTAMPSRSIWHASVEKDNYMYVLGGFLDPIAAKGDVYKGTVDQNGFIQWTDTTPLPVGLAQGAAVVVGNRIYFAGGFNNDVVYMADILANGNLGTWSQAGTLPSQMWGFVMVHSGNKLLIFGGETASGDISNVRSTDIQNDGTIGNWTELTPLPKSIRRGAGQILGNVMIMAGGIEHGYYLTTVYTSGIDANGNTTTWDQSLNNLPFPSCCFSLTSWRNNLYMTGGHDGTAYFSTVYTAVVDVEVPEPPTPTPTPLVTPSPTPIPINTTKVVIVPGLGGSWNSDALLGCKINDYAGGWTVASYAQPVYAPTVTALERERLTVNFYGYDWRKSVQEASLGLRAYIDTLTLPQEKVYLVGHSLGALVGEAFLERPADAAKVEKFLAVGGPLHGIPWAYGVWEGGEIWNDNLLIQIGATLATKKCVGLKSNRTALQEYLPVARDLLPIFDYLRQAYTRELISISDMQIHNEWLPRPLETVSLYTTVGTLTGEGKQTLSELLVSDPTKKERGRGDWVDGRVTGKLRSNLGDGTVLLTSAQIPGLDNRVISQSHLGLVMSPEGAGAIARFLVGSPVVLARAFNEPTSAIIVITENAQAIVTLPDQEVLQDISGVIAELNPKKGKHVLRVKPSQGNSKVTIGQFLANGNVVWQEQSFIGKAERIGTYNYSDSGTTVNFK